MVKAKPKSDRKKPKNVKSACKNKEIMM